MRREAHRIRLLIERDGYQAARDWVLRTLQAYREAVNSPYSHASLGHYRPSFEESIGDFEEWLAATEGEQKTRG
jgi:hypothetical protein